MPFEEPEIKQRPRLTGVKADVKLVQGLLKKDKMGRDQWLIEALNRKNRQALASVEEALAHLAGRVDLSFFHPSGGIKLDPGESQAAMDEILKSARSQQLLTDPVLTQTRMAMVVKDYNGWLMAELERISGEALQIYQLLGIQMQISILTGS